MPRQEWEISEDSRVYRGKRWALVFVCLFLFYFQINQYSKKELLVKSEPLGLCGHVGLACVGKTLRLTPQRYH